MEKIQIRTIRDINGNVYDIYDYMILDNFGRWRGKGTFFDIEEVKAVFNNSDILVEDKRS